MTSDPHQPQPPTPQVASAIQPMPMGSEIGLKDILREVRLWKTLILKNWYWLLLIALAGDLMGYLYARRDVPQYAAVTRFMLKTEGAGGLFGVPVGGLSTVLGASQLAATPLEKTAEVIGSDRIVGRALLREATLGDSTDLVINHFIRLGDLRKAWRKDSLLSRVRFNPADRELEELSLTQRKAFKQVKFLMAGIKDGVVRKSYDKKTGVLTMACVHPDEAFAIALSKVLFDVLGEFFREQMTYASANNAEVMRRKLDSIQGQLNGVRRAYARQSDRSLGLVLQQDKMDLRSLAVKEQMLTNMYAEAAKNYEGFQFANQAAAPSLTLLDAPYAPIRPVQKSKRRYSALAAVGALLAGFLILRLRHGLRSLGPI